MKRCAEQKGEFGRAFVYIAGHNPAVGILDFAGSFFRRPQFYGLGYDVREDSVYGTEKLYRPAAGCQLRKSFEKYPGLRGGEYGSDHRVGNDDCLGDERSPQGNGNLPHGDFCAIYYADGGNQRSVVMDF